MQTRRNFLGQAAAAVGTTGVLGVSSGMVVPERTIAAPNPPPASGKKPRITHLRHVEMYREPTNFCAEVQVEKLDGGEMVAVFGRDPGLEHIDAGSIPVIRSRDHGRTWDQKNPVTVFPIGDDYGWSTPSISKLSDGRLVAVAYGYELLTESGAPDFGKGYAGVSNPTGGSDFVNPHVAWSDDRGRTWPPPAEGSHRAHAPGRGSRCHCRDARRSIAAGHTRFALAASHAGGWRRGDLDSFRRAFDRRRPAMALLGNDGQRPAEHS